MFKHAYSVSDGSTDLICNDVSLTQQSFKDDADINVMLERFKITGVLKQGVRAPTYGDFTGISDYRSAVEAIHQATLSFMDLPAKVRSRFENDPQKFLEFCSDPKNRDEAVSLGLIMSAPASAPDPDPATVVAS